MAIGKLNLSVKTGLKKQMEKEQSGGRDGRFLNYFDLKTGEKMKVLFVPDANGEFWTKFSKHGPNLKLPGLDSINCPYKSARQNCPACQKGFDLLAEAKELGEKTPAGKEKKDEAKRWFAKDYTLVQVLVLESPCEIAESDDGNQVKLMYLPFAIEKIIRNAVMEEMVKEEELCSVPFYIKKTTNQGGQAAYTDSYFDVRSTITEDDLDYFDGLVVEPYDFSTLDLIPGDTTTEEVESWLVKAEDAEARKQGQGDGNGRGGRQQQSRDDSPRNRVSERLNRGTQSSDDSAGEEEEIPAATQTQQEEEPAQEATRSRGSALRDRLARTRR